MSDRGSAKRSSVQPNPGWGAMCEGCEHRIPPPRDSFPCKKREDAVLERKTPTGGDVPMDGKLGIDFWETCSKFQSISSW